MRFLFIASLLAWLAVGACVSGDKGGRDGDRLVIYNAGSLARPLAAALDTFARREGIRVAQENLGSLEAARKLTELGQPPDLIALADHEVFPQLLMPEHTRWYIQFARNRMVIAHGPRSRGVATLDTARWWETLLANGVEVGRADPDLDPAGYRAILVMRLAEEHYQRPGLAQRLLERAPTRNIRPKSAELTGLLQAGELDYVWVYQSVARAARIPYIPLPPEIDLGEAEHAARYARVEVRVHGRTRGDTAIFRGEPILYAMSIPERAANPRLAERLIAFLMSDEGVDILRAQALEVIRPPLLVGEDPPPVVRALLAPRTPASPPAER
ncbi:MAG TPA: extracellular solute-binding protein [Gemmatimonadaceae bacterium]|nr:extracellular solute-binding protein [Gemmatimonadaceae bacterium]